MNTAIVNVKVDYRVKKKAQSVASELGLSLSGLINALLHQVIRTKSVYLSAADEEPSDYLIRAIKESERDIKAGRVSPKFDSTDEAMNWLNNPRKKYANKIQ